MKRSIILIALAILVLGFASGCNEDNPTIPTLKYSSVDEHTFVVADNPFLRVETFVGGISVKTGAQDTIRVVVTRKAEREQDLNKIDVALISNPNELNIRAEQPSGLENTEAHLDITVPPGTRVELTAGVGSILFRGRPRDLNRFDVGVGSIALYLPSNVNVSVDLTVGVGSIDSDFIIEGQATNSTVIGTIGSGDEGEIRASTGVGSIDLLRL
jgi:hypothetical protein